MRNYKKLAKTLLDQLLSKKIINNVNMVDYFFDEPKPYHYQTTLLDLVKYSDSLPSPNETASGVSFTSRSLALLKCLSEAFERICLFNFDKKNIIYSTYNRLLRRPVSTLDPFLYVKNPVIRNEKFGWVKGKNATQNINVLLPAQLAFLTFFKFVKEPALTAYISTGGAFGFDRESTLLRGIYEVIERDAFITMYLNKVGASRIEVGSIKNKTIRLISEVCKRYNLELDLFNISNDIEVPVFLSVLIDKTGYGPSFTIGVKSSLHTEKAMIGSIEEAFLTRPWIRNELYKRAFKIPKINSLVTNKLINRGLFWASISMLKKIDFILRQKPSSFKVNPFTKNTKEEFKTIRDVLLKKGFNIYYVDVRLPMLKTLPYFIYRVIVPGLQPLYWNERHKTILIDRLRAAGKFFGKKRSVINNIPHPFC